jgi:signal transduction histidine kinase
MKIPVGVVALSGVGIAAVAVASGFAIGAARANSGASVIDDDDVAALRLGAHLRQLSRLNAAMSHDIRGPLNTVMLNLELLKESMRDEPATDQRERRGRYLRVLRDELERVRGMIETLLIQTRLSDGTIGPFDLRLVLRDLETLVRPYSRKSRVMLALELPAAEVCVSGSEDEIRQALLPLVLGALDAAPIGGTLALALTRADGAAIVSCAPRDAELAFANEVDGAASPAGVSEGRAMRAARALIDAHGGRLRLSRASAMGTSPRFELALPLTLKTS